MIPPSIEKVLGGAKKSIDVSTPVFKYGERIPPKYTCEGEDVSPPIEIKNIPKEAKALALIMYDPDAPIGVFYHWGLYNIPVDKTSLPENIPKTAETPYGLQASNDFGTIGYGGPCPPPGHGIHRYFFLVIALSHPLEAEPGISVRRLPEYIKGKALAYGLYMGTYSR